MTDEIVKIKGLEFTVCQCGSCGVLYMVPTLVHEHHRKEGGFAFCSNGHQWGWREGTKARDELRLERDRLKQDAARLIDERNEALREAREAKSKYLKVQKRAAAGVCPCCNRTFSNVQRHMKSKHPNVIPLDQKSG